MEHQWRMRRTARGHPHAQQRRDQPGQRRLRSTLATVPAWGTTQKHQRAYVGGKLCG